MMMTRTPGNGTEGTTSTGLVAKVLKVYPRLVKLIEISSHIEEERLRTIHGLQVGLLQLIDYVR
jgi:hypothetical protein